MTLKEIIKEHEAQSRLDRGRGLNRSADFEDETVKHLKELLILKGGK